MLCGRSTPAEIARSRDTTAALEALRAGGGTVEYRAIDLADADALQAAIAEIVRDHGRIDGILHSAGHIADNYILKKTEEEFLSVLAPKVHGTWHLDQATRDLDLDFFVLFSSLTSAVGNLGQADYAAANGFMTNSPAGATPACAPVNARTHADHSLAAVAERRHEARAGRGRAAA